MTDLIVQKLKDVQQIEFKGIQLYKKETPFYNSKILNVPLKNIIAGMIIFNLIKNKLK